MVATNVGGIPELIDDRVNGLLVPGGDVDALCTALTTIAENTDFRLRMGSSARETAAARFRIESTARAYERVYQAVLVGEDPVGAASNTSDTRSG